MKKFIVALSLILAGCSESDQDRLWPREQFILQDGTAVQCRWYEESACGVKLHDCTNGRVYTCQQGVSQ